MTDTERFLIALAIIFGLPYVLWRLGRTDYWAPLVVVQILTGIVLGPGLLGAAFPALYHGIFEPRVILALNGVAWWGVMLFVWLAGIELDLKEVWRQRRECGSTAALALGTPLLFGAAAAMLLLVWRGGWVGPRGDDWQFVLGVGMACAVTALPILVLLMDKLAILRTPFGQRVLRYASLDDVAIWAVLALILLDWHRIGLQSAFLLLFFPAAWLFRRLLRALPAADRWYVALVWLALVAFAADHSGLHFMVGSFLAGMVLDRDWFDRRQLDWLREHVLLVLMPVFFLSTGLRTGWSLGGAAVLGAAALLLVAEIAGKLAGVALAGRLLGWRRGDAWTIGWLLQTKALIMIIYVNILLDRSLISGDTFTALLLMAVVSTMLTVPMVAPRLVAGYNTPALASGDRVTEPRSHG